MKSLKIGAVAGRHEIPFVEGYLFDEIADVFDFEYMRNVISKKLENLDSVDLYVTGLTSVTAEVVAICAKNGIELTLWHFDKDSGEYRPQVAVSAREAWEIRTIRAETYGL